MPRSHNLPCGSGSRYSSWISQEKKLRSGWRGSCVSSNKLTNILESIRISLRRSHPDDLNVSVSVTHCVELILAVCNESVSVSHRVDLISLLDVADRKYGVRRTGTEAESRKPWGKYVYTIA